MQVTERFSPDDYGLGYFEHGQGSNYHRYGDDAGWDPILDVMEKFHPGTQLRIFEAGCAKGYFVGHARMRGHEARGFDLSEYAIGKAPDGAQGHVYQHDATTLWPERSNQFDIVCAWEFLEHIPTPHIETVLHEMLRTMKVEGGELWLKTGIVVPDDHPFAGKVEDHDKTHVSMYPREWWEDRFRQLGLIPFKDAQDELDRTFRNRDWYGRFFVWRVP